jgi:hypothetical protein
MRGAALHTEKHEQRNWSLRAGWLALREVALRSQAAGIGRSRVAELRVGVIEAGRIPLLRWRARAHPLYPLEGMSVTSAGSPSHLD